MGPPVALQMKGLSHMHYHPAVFSNTGIDQLHFVLQCYIRMRLRSHGQIQAAQWC